MKTDAKFTTIKIEDDHVYFNAYSKPLYHQCEHNSRIYNELSRCGGDSMFLVTYPICGGDKEITKHLCERHTNELINQGNALGLQIVNIAS